MALSNWDTLALDLDSKPISGGFESPSGVYVEFYKNWLYVHDKKGWHEHKSFSEPVVAEIYEGSLAYKDVQIEAVRGPQNGVYAVIMSGYDDSLKGVVGCGVSGYEDHKWVGVKDESVKFLHDFINHYERMTRDEALHEVKTVGGRSESEQCFEELIAMWMQPEYDFDEKVRAVKLDCALRYNQGDAYFARHLDFEIPATEPGKSEPPLISAAFEGKGR